MKKVFFGLFVILSLFSCDSNTPNYILNETAFCSGITTEKDPIVCKDKEGKLINGRVIEYFSNGRIQRIFTIKNGVPHGIWKRFYENGKQKSEINNKNGEYDGVGKVWYENGELDTKVYYKGGKRQGLVRTYYENGNLQSETNYKDDKPHGLSKHYYENGKLRSKNHVVMEGSEIKLDGDCIFFYENGNIQHGGSYKVNKKHGLMKVYYEDGKLHTEKFYKDDVPNGISKVYYRNGQLKVESYLKNGKLDGVEKEYYENGKIHTEINYKNDTKEGWAKEYYEDGKLQKELVYKNGVPNGISKAYYRNGQLNSEANMKNGELNGLFKAYNEYGILVVESEFKKGKEIRRKETPVEQIISQCKKYVDLCSDVPEKGCKTILQGVVVATYDKGIRINDFPPIFVRTKKDYIIGSVYKSKTYVEYMNVRNYRFVDNPTIKAEGYEFKETNIPVCY